jgi:hypothetical protein
MAVRWWLVAALVAVYVWAAYYRVPPTVQMLQTTLAAFRVDALLQKQPMVIAEQVARLDDVRKAWFPASFVKEATAPADTWTRVGAKYLVVQPRGAEGAEVLLCPPKCRMAGGAPHPDETLVAVPLKAYQLLILPFRYHFYTTSADVGLLVVNDWVSWALP